MPTEDDNVLTEDDLTGKRHAPATTSNDTLFDKDEVNYTKNGQKQLTEGERRSPLGAASAVIASGQFAPSRSANSQRSPKNLTSPNSAVGNTLLLSVGDSSFSLPEPTNLLDSSF